MKKIESKIRKGLKFHQLTSKSKRKVYREINRKYRGNKITGNIDYDEKLHLPKMAAEFFEAYPHIFYSYKLKIYVEC